MNATSSSGKGVECAMNTQTDAKSGWLGASCLGQYCERVVGLVGRMIFVVRGGTGCWGPFLLAS